MWVSLCFGNVRRDLKPQYFFPLNSTCFKNSLCFYACFQPPKAELWNGDLLGYVIYWKVHAASPGFGGNHTSSHTVCIPFTML